MRDNRYPLRDNLTFEEFSALACRQPDLNGDWVYRVESYLSATTYGTTLLGRRTTSPRNVRMA